MKKTIILISILINIFFGAHTQYAAKLLWQSDTTYKAPESVAYDAKRNCIYVSNYTSYIPEGGFYGNHTITKATVDGKILNDNFVTNVTNPTGVCIFNDILYIVERFGIVEFDLEKNKVTNRFKINGLSFINDVTTDPDGNIYVTDSDSSFVYKISGGKVEKIIQSKKLANQNGILYDNGKLIIGILSDNYVKTIDLKSKEIKKLAYVGPGTIDGIKKCQGGYLVSIYQGELWFVSDNGETKTLVNTREKEMYIADFEYIPEMDLLISPDLKNNLLRGYKITLE